ncbi:DNA-binding response regulator [Pleomorphomonas diazotrophica]|uniref:DNA-binding response regulator n=1 Tax=Pleomorphomonas diazotrophica TaxID=1166257 RepID=A0A1I4UV65_9HYPH|nr:response regulator transcription factor [Pleomorphomonas diazotrophica]PKR89808.1 DNA-binding response regulator [Pleomorphomonas diazotrophica]SFM92643.1 DNA-binding response regulator, OmpR family, contains REC and winged-helix (wHTH) domain [Pleomorphomonas diazotrophica]
MTKPTVLLIDDDADLCRLLEEYVQRFGIRLIYETRLETGLRRLRRDGADLAILDVMLPDGNGMNACRDIRAASDLPIILLTARGETADRVMGLEMGADDYVPKPFEPRELVARVDALLRRLHPTRKTLVVGPLSVDMPRRIASLDGTLLDLSSTEFTILAALVGSRGAVLSRTQLLRAACTDDLNVTDRAADMAISRLREKLGDDPRSPRLIKTIRGLGYQFIG